MSIRVEILPSEAADLESSSHRKARARSIKYGKSEELLASDFAIGDWGELAVYKTYGGRPPISMVLEEGPSWDLSDTGLYSVKAQSMASSLRYETSWVFQISQHGNPENPRGSDPASRGEGKDVVCCIVDKANLVVDLVAKIPASDIPGLLKPLKVHGRNDKRAIYLKDIPREFLL